MSIVLDGSLGITTPDLASGPVAGTTANFSGNVTLGSSVLATPSGSAPSYTCRAWVNFNGTGTVAIRASGNVSSITDNGTGDYTVNFTTAMPDANYGLAGFGVDGINSGATVALEPATNPTASNVRVVTVRHGAAILDTTSVSVSIFR